MSPPCLDPVPLRRATRHLASGDPVFARLETLTIVKGIGRWAAEMYLMFRI